MSDICVRCELELNENEVYNKDGYQFCERCADSYDYWWRDKE